MDNDFFDSIIKGELNRLRGLIANSADVNAIILPPEWTPLLIAVECNNPEVVRLLLSYGANANIANFNKQTLLHIAVNKNAISIARLLIEDGNAEVNVLDGCGYTPLKYAKEFGYTEIIELLIAHAGIE
jgi:ankyrin repeat protein